MRTHNLYKRKAGKFSIPIGMLDTLPDLVKEIMGHCVIFRAEMLYLYNSIEYFAYSDLFNTIEIGEVPPTYRIITENNKFKGFELDENI